MADHYESDELFIVFGDDFRYMNAFQNFFYMDQMIEYMNKYHGDHYLFKYSTPSDYIDAINGKDIKWPTKYDDMFPYSDRPDAYWTGYFTSRSNDKEFIRRASSNFHSSNILYSEKILDQSLTDAAFNEIIDSRNVMLDQIGILAHHDAVTGTERQAVAFEYEAYVAKALSTNNEMYGKLLGEKASILDKALEGIDWVECLRTNSSYLDCPVT